MPLQILVFSTLRGQLHLFQFWQWMIYLYIQLILPMYLETFLTQSFLILCFYITVT
nr:MAG TPA: hypothetical protein [Caudoviricetes sp.]